MKNRGKDQKLLHCRNEGNGSKMKMRFLLVCLLKAPGGKVSASLKEGNLSPSESDNFSLKKRIHQMNLEI